MKKLLLALITLCSIAHCAYQARDFSHLIGMPGFSQNLLTMHFKLYEGYVKNTNQLLEKIATLESSNQTQSLEYSGLKRMLGFEFDGMRLHELYFENLGGKEALDSKSELYRKIAADFGSMNGWQSAFQATGMLRGVGWSILYYDPSADRLYNVWVAEHNINELAGCHILLAMDVWEHAYITEYGLNRGAYIEAFMKNVDWSVVTKRFNASKRRF